MNYPDSKWKEGCVQFSTDVKSNRSSPSSQLSTIIIFQSFLSLSLLSLFFSLLQATVSISRHIYLGFCRYRDSRENRCCDAHPARPLCHVKYIRRILLLTGAPL